MHSMKHNEPIPYGGPTGSCHASRQIEKMNRGACRLAR
jgi:hypothetical protein